MLKKGGLYPMYSYGLITLSVSGWVLGTVLGAIAGQIMPQRLISCLGLAIYGMFIAIIIPDTKENKNVRAVVIAAMILSTAFTFAPFLNCISSGFRIIIITVLVAACAAVVAPVKEEKDE